jgi:Fur family ferric uptake transcriptional regulator
MSESSGIEHLLKHHNLKVTPTRLDILREFQSKSYAISHAELSDGLGEKYDRVTIYRTLNSFEEKGLIHSIVLSDSLKKYALCGHSCESDSHVHNHIHFTCVKCTKTVCLDDFTLNVKNKFQDYEFQELNITARGVCPDCKK